MADPPACCSKQLAVVSMEMEGLAVKLNGYERALQDCELQLAERDLQVVLLKSFIKDLDSPSHLQLNFKEVLEHNTLLQQQVQELALHAAPAHTAPAHTAPAQALPAASTTTSMQVSLLRAALAEANYRLTAAGVLPVAASAGVREPHAQDANTINTSTPANRRSYSRLFRNKYSTSSLSIIPTKSSASSSSGAAGGITPSSSTGSKASPCAAALSLAFSSGSGAATPAQGPDTPVGLAGNLPACTPGPTSSLTPSCCTTPAQGVVPGAGTATISAAAAAAASCLDAAFEGAVTAEERKGPAASAAGTAGAVHSVGDAFRCGGYNAGDLSDSASESAGSSQQPSSAPASPSVRVTAAAALASRPASPNVMCLLGSPSRILTPPCSPCSSISCEGAGLTRAQRLSYEALKSLPGLPTGWTGVTCSCDNPLFTEQYGDRLGC